MISALISGLSSPSSSPGKENCVVFIIPDNPLHPGVLYTLYNHVNGYQQTQCWINPVMC